MNMTIKCTILCLLLISCGKTQTTRTNTITESAIVERKSISESVEVSGNIQPIQQKILSFNQNGTIQNIFALSGENVVKNQVIAELHSEDLMLQIAQKQFEIEQQRHSASPRQLEILEMQMEQLTKKRDGLQIRAPFTGMIINLNYSQYDQYINDGNQKPFANFVNNDVLISKVNIDELDIPLVEIGQKVIFKFDALPGKEFYGTVSKLSAIGKLTDRGIAVREAELRIENPDPEIFIPYSFSAQILISDSSDVLILNESAIIHQEDKTFVKLINETSELHEVIIKPYKFGKVIVISGLNEGDEVVIDKSGSNNLQEEEEFF